MFNFLSHVFVLFLSTRWLSQPVAMCQTVYDLLVLKLEIDSGSNNIHKQSKLRTSKLIASIQLTSTLYST
jgi:hypothetical protein